TNLARNIGIEVISEGVEDLRQNAILTRIGCQVIQGYLISPAIIEADAVKLLEEYNVHKTKKLEQPEAKKGKEGKA
ncbi:MAG: EAL domain-containing protein, partial [Candidatus Moranbacteria bacterium]|nr:EAL domain-containing protein [Candidatus Moranbacteria bacterium]